MASLISRPIVRKIPKVVVGGRVHDLVVRIDRDGIRYKLDKERWSSSHEQPWASGYMNAARITAVIAQKEKAKKRLAKRGLLK